MDFLPHFPIKFKIKKVFSPMHSQAYDSSLFLFCSLIPSPFLDHMNRFHLEGNGHLPMQETKEAWILSLSWEDPLEKSMTTHSSFLAWRIPWTESLVILKLMAEQVNSAFFFENILEKLRIDICKEKNVSFVSEL